MFALDATSFELVQLLGLAGETTSVEQNKSNFEPFVLTAAPSRIVDQFARLGTGKMLAGLAIGVAFGLAFLFIDMMESGLLFPMTHKDKKVEKDELTLELEAMRARQALSDSSSPEPP